MISSQEVDKRIEYCVSTLAKKREKEFTSDSMNKF